MTIRELQECRGCRRLFGNLAFHEPRCLAAIALFEAELPTQQAFEMRAASHSAAETTLRAAQRWQHGVTDVEVTLVMYALEGGTRPYRNQAGRWLAPIGSPIGGRTSGLKRNLSVVIGEMIRTGLVRHVRQQRASHLSPAPQDVLVPAHVHLKDGEPGAWRSACLFTGEDLGPMRARLVDDLSLVDCLACELTVATGHPRGL
jgi:hypothetical protein